VDFWIIGEEIVIRWSLQAAQQANFLLFDDNHQLAGLPPPPNCSWQQGEKCSTGAAADGIMTVLAHWMALYNMRYSSDISCEQQGSQHSDHCIYLHPGWPHDHLMCISGEKYIKHN